MAGVEAQISDSFSFSALTRMAPLSQALALELLQPCTRGGSSKHTYRGIVDPEWVIAKTPNGGYVLSLLVKACMKFQEKSKHRDPVHVTAHFMLPTTVSSYQIEVEIVHSGSRFTNLLAKLVQDGATKVMAPMVFGTLPEFDAPPSSKKYENISPSHPLYHRIPIVSHPSKCQVIHISTKHYGFLNHIQHAEDSAINQRNKSKLAAPPDTHAGGLESGLWMELTNEDEELGLAVIPVFADLYRRTPSLLSEAYGNGILITRYPTVLITLEFKCQLPRRGTPGYSDRTLGLYSRNLFLNQGRHDGYCELWSAPSSIGEAGESDESDAWKREMRCIAVANQLALTSSFGNGARGQKKAKL
ncbi:hypothetical protein FRC10_005432 [Ceratobasidium sp. 414]|nr:hypothetical protein FRC10_005432 [Ceratobasidium sp. 414]